MIEINLKKARAVLKKLDAEILELESKLRKGVTVNVNYYNCGGLTQSELEEKVEELLKESKVEYLNLTKEVYGLISLKYKIRGLVDEKNHEAELSKVLTSKNLILSKRNILREQIKTLKSNLKSYSIEEVSRRVESKPDANAYNSFVNLGLPFLGEEELVTFRQQEATLDKKLEELEDQIAKINLTSVIGLTEEDLGLLALVNVHL